MPSPGRIVTGIRHPRRALQWLLLGEKKFSLLYGPVKETCVWITEPRTFLEEHMAKMSDIHEHLATLFMLTVELNLKVVVELGTRDGESTVALLAAAKEIGGHVTSIDITPSLKAHEVVERYGLLPYWSFVQSDDLAVEWARPIDHLFIDTSHTFEQTLGELRKYEPLVSRGGVITMHDAVSSPGVLQALDSYCEGRRDLRVYKYFNCFGLAVVFKR